MFATPQFCQSRVCGPVVDVAEQAKHEYGDKAAFIHMEIYNDNDPGKGVRPQVRAFHLPSEPWLFTIDRRGVVSGAIEGAFGLKLMDEAVEKAIARMSDKAATETRAPASPSPRRRSGAAT